MAHHAVHHAAPLVHAGGLTMTHINRQYVIFVNFGTPMHFFGPVKSASKSAQIRGNRALCWKVYQLENIDFFNFSISRFSLSGNLPAGKHACYICGDDVHANDFPSSVHEEIPHDYQVCTIKIIWQNLTMFICIN